ncbi:von Willebrand factor D and EGF domain-containing protein-like [Ptychodera flava]|uniref:von Willebrand factor D and EGF domain-containing protein-like n=1 Tax=Ptychodera flava TaxID=63121 RepID=UPI00396A42C1
MNVFVQSTSDDDENSFGLCGMTALNIATSVPSSVQADSDNYCACIVSEAGDEFDSEGCGFNTDVFQPISEYDLHREIDITNSLSTFLPRQQRSLTRRKQRSVFMPPEIEWPTANGVTQEEADRSCRWAIQNSSLADFCGDVEGVDMFIGVNGCVYDIGMTDGFEMVNNAVLMMEDLCEEMVLKNLSYYEQITSTDDIMAVPPSLIRHRCRFDCSGRGYCADGVCQCNEGYGDVDCSDLSKPPIIWSINGAYERYACNGAEEDCRSVSIIGNNFLNSPSLTCHFSQELEPATHTTAVAADEQTLTATAATFISFWEVICQLPANLVTDHNSREIAASLSTLEIHVSNDAGVGLSNGLLFTEFDSECIDCDETGVCTPKDTFCIIGGLCYADGDYHPNDDTLQCLVTLSQFDWSGMATTVDFAFSVWMLAILITSAIVLAGVGVILLLYWRYRKRQKNQKVEPSTAGADSGRTETSHK